MKLLGSKKTRWGIAMTEYLIILAIVAIAAIAVVGLFGRQIKSAFTRSNTALTGQNGTTDTQAASDSQAASKQDNMGTFDKSANQNK